MPAGSTSRTARLHPTEGGAIGIVEPVVRLARPTISLRAFLEAAAQPGQNFRAQGTGLGEEPGRLPEIAIQNLAFQPATKAIRAPPPLRRCSRIDFHNNGGIVAGVQTDRPHADPLVLDHERKELVPERVISRPSPERLCKTTRRYWNVRVAELPKERRAVLQREQFAERMRQGTMQPTLKRE